MGQAPTSQARPRDIHHLRPSNIAARTLRSVEHAPKFGHDPWPVRRGLVAAVRCCVRKARFFSLSGPAVEQNKRSQSLVWVLTPQRGKPVWFSVFRFHGENLVFLFFDPIIVGLKEMMAS